MPTQDDYLKARDVATRLRPLAPTNPEARKAIDLIHDALGAPVEDPWATEVMLRATQQGEEILSANDN